MSSDYPPETLATYSAQPSGLSSEDVLVRQSQGGYNEVILPKRTWLTVLKRHVWGPIPWLIESAFFLSVLVGDWQDAGIIGTLFLINLLVGLWQEHKAAHSIARLEQKLVRMATVKRDGAWHELLVRELVVGDLIRIRLGDIVPADAIILTDGELQVDQSSLTGESLPQDYKQCETVYAGSVILKGEADAVVAAIGEETEYGATEKLVQSEIPPTSFELTIRAITRYVIFFAFCLVAIVFAFGVLHHDGLVATLTLSLVLVVAAIPVALPTVLSLTMAIGSLTLVKHKAIVQRLSAIEELAGMDVLCTDKTGTLTQNKLSITHTALFGDIDEKTALALAATAVKQENDEPVQRLIWNSMEQQALTVYEQYTTKSYQAFNPDDKYSKSSVATEATEATVYLGAVPAVLETAAVSSDTAAEVQRAVSTAAEAGERSLLMAVRYTNGETACALFSISDTLRADSADTVLALQKLGIRVLMITGDHIAVAKSVATAVHIQGDIKPASAVAATTTDENVGGYAGVLPRDKFNLVEQLQACGAIVGMTGDGVNDAPALHRAQAGIAVAGATDAARKAADIVCTAPGLSAVTAAVMVSRDIFQRMHAYALYRIAETIRILLFVTTSVLLFGEYPVTATMIVLLAILNDASIMAIAYDRTQAVLTPLRFKVRELVFSAAFFGIVGVLFTSLFFWYVLYQLELPTGVVQTLVYLKLSIAGHFLIFLTRTTDWMWRDRPGRILVGAVVITQIIATLIAVFGIWLTPVPLNLVLGVWLYVLITTVLVDTLKVLYFKLRRKQTTVV